MSDHADVIRERMGVCLALHGDRDDCPACVSYREGQAALDALVAERDEAKKELIEYAGTPLEDAFARAEAAEAEVARRGDLLRRLRQWDHMAVAADGTFWIEIDAALAAPTKEDTDE